jgi:hypothetical protein
VAWALSRGSDSGEPGDRRGDFSRARVGQFDQKRGRVDSRRPALTVVKEVQIQRTNSGGVVRQKQGAKVNRAKCR